MYPRQEGLERARRDLNPRHLGPEPSALSAELRALAGSTGGGGLILLTRGRLPTIPLYPTRRARPRAFR